MTKLWVAARQGKKLYLNSLRHRSEPEAQKSGWCMLQLCSLGCLATYFVTFQLAWRLGAYHA